MNRSVEQHQTAPLVHGRMIYRCKCCGRSWPMYLEKGIEEFGENHKPSPFIIECPHCGGWANDVSGIQKVPGGGYVPLPDGYSYFANTEDRDCGVPVFQKAIRPRSGTPILIADELDSLARAEKIARKAVPGKEIIEKTSAVIAEETGVPLEQAVAIVLKALQYFADRLEKAIVSVMVEPDDLREAIEQGEPPDIATAWDRKEAREKQRVAERAAASRFRQYKARENTWGAGKRTGARGREWRGADRS